MKVVCERKFFVLVLNVVYYRVDFLIGIVIFFVIFGVNFLLNVVWFDFVGGLLIFLFVIKVGLSNIFFVLYEFVDWFIDEEVCSLIKL